MHYYIVRNSLNNKEVGKALFQCKSMPEKKSGTRWFDEPNSMTNLTNNEFPDFVPDLQFELENKAKLTDIIKPTNLPAQGFLLSEKAKAVFESFNLMEHLYYNAIVITPKGELP
jgi:restriction endonuclease